MSTQLQQYQFNTHQFRVIPDDQGEPWFVAKDVCDILEYSNSRKAIKDHCRKSGVTNSYTPALSNTYNLIDEGNLYRLIIKSNKPQSQAFEDWVCDEILPSIRKTGGYQIDTAVDNQALETLQTENSQLKAENQQLRAQSHSLQDKYTDVLEYKVAQLEQKTLKRTSKGPVSHEERKTIINMHLSGYSRSEIANKTGRSTSAIYSIIREYKAGVSA